MAIPLVRKTIYAVTVLSVALNIFQFASKNIDIKNVPKESRPIILNLENNIYESLQKALNLTNEKKFDSAFKATKSAELSAISLSKLADVSNAEFPKDISAVKYMLGELRAYQDLFADDNTFGRDRKLEIIRGETSKYIIERNEVYLSQVYKKINELLENIRNIKPSPEIMRAMFKITNEECDDMLYVLLAQQDAVKDLLKKNKDDKRLLILQNYLINRIANFEALKQ